jgi:osmotically-inducible protein OsmY
MVATQTTLTNPAEFTRCDDRSLASEEEQHLHQKRDKTDGSIAEKVDIALWNYRDIEVNVKEAIVYLSGHVPSTTIQQKAEDTARMIRGVQGIKSNLVPDDKLSLEVAGALGKIEHTYGVKFFTGVQNGFVVLNGEMSSAEARDLAEKCAAGIPAVY